MSSMKNENVTKCFSLLREFVENAESRNDNKEFAILAIEHLQRITAGEESNGASGTSSGGTCQVLLTIWPDIH